jgi:uncharacterized protein YqgC (DUF456 family)
MLWFLALPLVVIGIIGTVVPALPGPILVFAGLLAAAWADGFTKVGAFTLTVLGLLTIPGYVVDVMLTAMGVQRLGATRYAMIGAALGTMAGVFLGLPGIVIGPFVGALAVEYIAMRDMRAATRAGLGAWLGLLLGTAAKLGIVFAMLGIFIGAYLL